MRALRSAFTIVLAVIAITGAPTAASASLSLDGSFTSTVTKPSFTGDCPPDAAGECGSIDLDGLGTADWTYIFGPTFEPQGHCFAVDGTFILTLRSDGSSTAGALTGVFCPRPSATAHERAAAVQYGNPYVEDDTITFTAGTGQFDGLVGTASFHTVSAGARFTGWLSGSLS